jgi:hypothetical protein
MAAVRPSRVIDRLRRYETARKSSTNPAKPSVIGKAKFCAADHISNRNRGAWLTYENKRHRGAAMTELSKRTGRRVLFAAVAAVGTLIANTSFAGPAYDGVWSVLVHTEKGDCDPGYRYPIRISNGHLVNAGDTAFTITGAVAPTGAITVTVSAAGKSANGSGHLAGTGGGGSWTGGACSGSWTAERRGA